MPERCKPFLKTSFSVVFALSMKSQFLVQLHIFRINILNSLISCSSVQGPCKSQSDQVPSECPLNALRVPTSKCLKCLSALRVSLNAHPVPKCLIKCNLKEILSMKRCFMKKKEMQKIKHRREEFKKLNIDVVSKR